MTYTEQEAETFLRSLADLTRESLQQLSSLFGDPAATAAAEKLLDADEHDNVMEASALVYAAGGEDPAVLAALLDDERASLRIVAAEGLLARGDRRGFEPLIVQLERAASGEDTPWRTPARHLVRWTARGDLGPPLDADDEQLRTAAEAWRTWFIEEGERVMFGESRWRVP